MCEPLLCRNNFYGDSDGETWQRRQQQQQQVCL
jgi:hypothetical protein